MRICKFWRIEKGAMQCFRIKSSCSKIALMTAGVIPRAGWQRKRPRVLIKLERSPEVQAIKRAKAQHERTLRLRRLAYAKELKGRNLRSRARRSVLKSAILTLP